MKLNGIEHYDHFETETVFWLDISDLPGAIQDQAREIDGGEYDDRRFGICAIYDWGEKAFDLITDTDLSTGESRNVFYIDLDGDKHWFKTDLDAAFIQRVFAACCRTEVMESALRQNPSLLSLLRGDEKEGPLNTEQYRQGDADMATFDDLFTSPAVGDNRSYESFDKDAWAAQKQQERDDVYRRIDDYVADMCADGGVFQAYLDVQARFDRYSVNNAILVASQLPEATKLQSYDDWKASGVYVRRGQDAISILEPGREYERDDGSVGVSYNVKKVFDISQTNSRQRRSPTVSRDDRLLLKALIHRVPCKLQISAEMPEHINALYKPEDNTIYLRQGMDAGSIFRGLSQELARAHIARGGYDCVNADFTAYCVAYLLCQRNGVAVDTFRFDRLPERYGTLEPQAVRDELGAMREVAGEITADMNRVFTAQQKQQQNRDDGAR